MVSRPRWWSMTRSCVRGRCSRSRGGHSELGWHSNGVGASLLPGPSGTSSTFLWLRTQTDRALSAKGGCGALCD